MCMKQDCRFAVRLECWLHPAIPTAVSSMVCFMSRWLVSMLASKQVTLNYYIRIEWCKRHHEGVSIVKSGSIRNYFNISCEDSWAPLGWFLRVVLEQAHQGVLILIHCRSTPMEFPSKQSCPSGLFTPHGIRTSTSTRNRTGKWETMGPGPCPVSDQYEQFYMALNFPFPIQ